MNKNISIMLMLMMIIVKYFSHSQTLKDLRRGNVKIIRNVFSKLLKTAEG